MTRLRTLGQLGEATVLEAARSLASCSLRRTFLMTLRAATTGQ